MFISLKSFNKINNASNVITLSMVDQLLFRLENDYVEYLTSPNNYYLQYLILVGVLRYCIRVLDNPKHFYVLALIISSIIIPRVTLGIFSTFFHFLLINDLYTVLTANQIACSEKYEL